ncbi:ATP-dependent RNA helicase DDX52/ROK1 [Geosmithia morbida]|uniref:ATP-dependent RNA helicase n=1 Tax=Geosmithia morbida TaxID=1094350 RepID=A0A9P4YXY3_9HYPO|nr:ATP-dependent RNA helicase DDX52/ROK1 [Geosmithia morbida]KAF4125136.1 ATP-dependent RNA helicase DDX52/ROK1 [Geosmithia morbida]
MPPSKPKESNDPRNSSARDLFRILTRGTNIKSSAFERLSAKLPSAGTAANPQLFHDETRGQKRKRTVNKGGESDENGKYDSEPLPVVDFFASKPEVGAAAAQTTTYDDDDDDDEAEDDDGSDKPAADTPLHTQQLTKEECLQVLKSHRIKVTLMWRQQEERVRAKKSKKKAKKEQDEDEGAAAKKDGKKPLFPQPLESFSQLRSIYGISNQLACNLDEQAYREPTEVQLGSLPLLLRPDQALHGETGVGDGVDFLAVAPTGSGKTVSFLVTVINSIQSRRRREGLQESVHHELEAVIVAPTRELVHQILLEANKLTKGTGLHVAVMKKGMDPASQGRADNEEEAQADSDDDDIPKTMSAPAVDILVTTPVRLFKYLTEQGGPSEAEEEEGSTTAVTKALPTVRELVLDEADVVLDPLFRTQTLGVWTACTNPALRASFWSATMGSSIEGLVTEHVRARASSTTGMAQPRPLVRLVVGLKDAAVPNITHKLIFTGSEQGKPYALRQLFRPTSKDDFRIRLPFLVFTETVDRAVALHDEVRYDIPASAGGSSRIASLHSGLSDSARAAVVRKFRAGDIWLLITTDIVARGLDFRGLNGVVNYDVPSSAAAYVHRAGRTGRAGRQGGVAVTLWTQADVPILKTIANVIVASERQAGKTDPADSAVPSWLLDRLPDVSKGDKKKLKRGGRNKSSKITTTSGYERQKENNRLGAIEASKRRKKTQQGDGHADDEWNGLDD